MLATTDPVSTEGTVARARGHLERIVATRLRCGDDLTKRRREFDAVRRDSGDRAFAGRLAGDGVGLAQEIGPRASAILIEIETLEVAESAGIEAQVAALRKVRAALADVKRREAAEKRAEADRRQPESDRLRAAWADFEGVPPEILGVLQPQAAGVPLLREGKTAATGGGPRIVPVRTLRTQLLRIEAAALERQAEAILAQPIVRAGHCQLMLDHAKLLARSADDVADEVITLAVADPERVFPRTSEVRRAIVDVFTREQERRRKLTADHPHVGVPEVFELNWRDAQVVETRSRRAVAHKVRVLEGTTKVLGIDEWE